MIVGAASAVGEQVQVVEGRGRTLKADLVVVDGLARLYDCDEDTLCHVLGVFGRGVHVVTLASWSLASRTPSKNPSTSIIRHRPLALETRATFFASSIFQARESAMVNILQELTELQGSKWQLTLRPVANGGRREATSETCFHCTGRWC